MGFKTLIKLLVALVICAVAFGIVKCSSDTQGVTTVESTSTKKKVFPSFPINEVAQVKIIEKGETLTLNKKGADWQVAERADYPAETSKVIELIRNIWDLDIAQPVALQRNQFGRLQLLDPTAEETSDDEAAAIVSLSDASGKELGSMWLGKTHETSDGRPSPFGGMSSSDSGRYVKRGGSNAVFIVEETFNTAEAKPKDWLDDSFFAVAKIKSIGRNTGKPEQDWTLSREDVTEDFVLEDAKEGEELDVTKTTALKTAFTSPRFDDVFSGDGAEVPDNNTFTVSTFDGFTYTIKAGEKNDVSELPLSVAVTATFPEKREEGEEESDEEKKSKDEAFAKELETLKEKLANEQKLAGRVFKVRSFVIDPVTKVRADFLKEPEEEPAEEEAAAPAVPTTPPAAPEGEGE